MALIATTCTACGTKLPPGRYLYCSDLCSFESRRLVWRTRFPDRAYPRALAYPGEPLEV